MRKVALCGFGRTLKTDWPADVEIWTINCAWDGYGFNRIDRLLEMHPIEQLTADLNMPTLWEGRHWIWLQEQHPFPIYMMKTDPRIPNSTEYPLDEICRDIFSHLYRGDEINKYMTSSASYLLAMAIHERYDVIYLAGFEMATQTEYAYQMAGATYLIGLANGRSIDVILPENSGMLKARLYSYEGGQMIYRNTVIEHQQNYQQQYNQYFSDYEANPNPDTFCKMARANGANVSLTSLLEKSELPFFGRQGLDYLRRNYETQLNNTLGMMNKYNTIAIYNAMLQAEGAVQAFQNLITVCDLQDPNLTIHAISHFVELKPTCTEEAKV